MEQIQVSSLKANKDNPRHLTKGGLATIKKSINGFKKMMALRPLVVDKDNIVIGGNQRLRAIKSLGIKKIPENWVMRATDLTPAERKEFIAKDNINIGEWDWDIINNDWDKSLLEEWGLTIPGAEDEGETVTEDNYTPPKEIKTNIKRGDIFQIGVHRLLCGDSSNKTDVNKLLQNNKPTLMITDPPYGVEYDADWRNHAARHSKGMGNRKIGAGAIGKVINDNQSDWTLAWQLSPSNIIYIWHAGKYAGVVSENIIKAGFEIRNQIIWVKSHFAIGRGDYHWKHEPCWYAVRKGQKGNWISDRKQTTVWEINKSQNSDTGHSTQKPIECMFKPISHHDGDVYDPFCGSGTTIIAAQQLKRKCYAMEIDEKYCHIIIDRYLKLYPTTVITKNGKPYKHKVSK